MKADLLANAERAPSERPYATPPPNDRPAPNDYPWHGSAWDELRRKNDEIDRLRARVRELEFQVGGAS